MNITVVDIFLIRFFYFSPIYNKGKNIVSEVFQRTKVTGAIISDAAYNFVIGAVLCWGFLVNWYMVKNIDYTWLASINIMLFLLCYLGSCFLGVYIFNKSSNPVISFFGYNLVVVPFGMVVNLVVHQYDPAVVLDAVRVTGLVTMTMMILGSMFPGFFQKIAGALTFALIAVIIIEVIEIFILGIHHGIIDWVVVLIFCGYIGYDWGRANRIPKTVDNAVDCAAALYMDIINLFLRILRIMGRRD